MNPNLTVPDDHWSQSPEDVAWVVRLLTDIGVVHGELPRVAKMIVTHVRSSLLGQQRANGGNE